MQTLQTRLLPGLQGRERVWSRALVVTAVAWLPLAMLAAAHGVAVGSAVKIPLLFDYAVNVRLLLTLPLLILADIVIDPKIREAVKHFVDAGLVTKEQLPAYEDALRRTKELRDSRLAALCIVLLAFAPSIWMRGADFVGHGASTWRVAGQATSWFSFVSLPLYRLLLFRWIWLMAMWAVFLSRVVRLNLRCLPCHPDRAAGLGFIGRTQVFFGPITFASSAVVAGGVANLLIYEGSSISKLKFQIAGFCILAVIAAAAPLLTLTPKLFQVREQGLLDYGALGVEYTSEFDRKWIHGERSATEPLLGTPDIRSLADLNNSVAIVSTMKTVPIDREVFVGLVAPVVLPMIVPLSATIPAADIFKTVMRLLV